MTSIDLLRTLNDEELIAFILMMSKEYMLSQWVANVHFAKKFIKEGKKRDFLGCKIEDFETWKRNLTNEASEMEKQVYNGEFDV